MKAQIQADFGSPKPTVASAAPYPVIYPAPTYTSARAAPLAMQSPGFGGMQAGPVYGARFGTDDIILADCEAYHLNGQDFGQWGQGVAAVQQGAQMAQTAQGALSNFNAQTAQGALKNLNIANAKQMAAGQFTNFAGDLEGKSKGW